MPHAYFLSVKLSINNVSIEGGGRGQQKQNIDRLFHYNSLCKAENFPDDLLIPKNALQLPILDHPVKR